VHTNNGTHTKQGKIVPVEVTIRLLKAAMERSGARDFLIDGFPRSADNLDGWFQVMGDQAEVCLILLVHRYSILLKYTIYSYHYAMSLLYSAAVAHDMLHALYELLFAILCC
jgi:Adenylate kinase